MLSSARKSYARQLVVRIYPAVTSTYGFCQALPAESSRQAQVRATFPTVRTRRAFDVPRATYATAAALINETSGVNQLFDFGQTPAMSTIEPSRSKASPSDTEEVLFPSERFRRKKDKDPLGALIYLSSLSRKDLTTVSLIDIRSLLFNLDQAAKGDLEIRSQFPVEEIIRALRVVRAILHARPSSDNVGERDAFIGKSFKSSSLRTFLRLCIAYGARHLGAEVFKERMDDQLRSGRHIVDVDGFATDLASAREWGLIATLFSKPSPCFPVTFFSPAVIATAMAANLHLNRPESVITIYNLQQSIGSSPTPEAYNCIVQAYLQLGNVEAARKVVHGAHSSGQCDYAKLQLAILRGYRTLGYDADIEERSRRDLERLQLEPKSAFLNALIRLRLDAGDVSGAEQILSEFELFGDGRRRITPDNDTVLVAMSIASRRGDSALLRRLWASTSSRHSLVTDNTVAHLFRALGRLGYTEEAFLTFSAAVHGGPAPWFIPPGFVPGIKSANVVLRLLTDTRKFDGLSDVAKLMRAASIKPDARTLTIVVDFARNHLVSSPSNLAKLLQDLLDRSPGVRPTIDQLDVILAEAVRTATREIRASGVDRNLGNPPGSGSIADPTGGIVIKEKFNATLQRILQSLRSHGIQSSARSMANRILYDSLALDGANKVPSAQQVWNVLALRGYRPEQRHYHALIRGYSAAGVMNEAENVLKLARDSGITPTIEMMTTIIVGWARQGDMFRARRAYELVRRSPGRLDVGAFSAIVRGYISVGQPNTAVHIAREDFSAVEPDDIAITTVAHAIRSANDIPGSVFFVNHYAKRQRMLDATGPSTLRVLSPGLRKVIRQSVNYLNKTDCNKKDVRWRNALELARQMLSDDDEARPATGHARRQQPLSKSNRRVIVEQIAPLRYSSVKRAAKARVRVAEVVPDKGN